MGGGGYQDYAARLWPQALRVPLRFPWRAQVWASRRISDLPTAGPRRAPKLPPAVLWLQPLSGKPVFWPAAGQRAYQLVQKDKMFQPQLLVIPAGSLVSFPNQDPFFHNVFSLFEGKRFDLGLYEAGSTREVRFSNPSISYILQHSSRL